MRRREDTRRPMEPVLPHTFEHRVNYSETDQMGFVYYANYLVWFEIGRTEALRAMGLPYRTLEEKGYFLPVVRAEIDYHEPARYDDMIVIKSDIAEVRKSRVTFSNEIINKHTGKILAEGRVVLACLDGSRKPVRLPKEIGAARVKA